jgi:hypothetical protein
MAMPGERISSPTFQRFPEIRLFGAVKAGEEVVLAVDLTLSADDDVEGTGAVSDVGDWVSADVDIVVTSGELELDADELKAASVRVRRNAKSKPFLIAGVVRREAQLNGSVQVHTHFLFQGRRVAYARRMFQVALPADGQAGGSRNGVIPPNPTM